MVARWEILAVYSTQVGHIIRSGDCNFIFIILNKIVLSKKRQICLKTPVSSELSFFFINNNLWFCTGSETLKIIMNSGSLLTFLISNETFLFLNRISENTQESCQRKSAIATYFCMRKFPNIGDPSNSMA